MSMRILVANDDGITAPGLAELVSHLTQIPEVDVYVVAPSRQWSARGHAITIHEPIYAKKLPYDQFSTPAWEVSGSPADCIKLGLNQLVGQKDNNEIDFVISGINNGPNLATDVLYSGTVAAAIEGVLANIPSIAVSLGASSERAKGYTSAARFASALVQVLNVSNLSSHPCLLNVNVPANDSFHGIEITDLGPCPYDDWIRADYDSEGHRCYWLKADHIAEAAEPSTDLAAIASNRVSITPLQFFDVTDRTVKSPLSTMAEELESKLC